MQLRLFVFKIEIIRKTQELPHFLTGSFEPQWPEKVKITANTKPPIMDSAELSPDWMFIRKDGSEDGRLPPQLLHRTNIRWRADDYAAGRKLQTEGGGTFWEHVIEAQS